MKARQLRTAVSDGSVGADAVEIPFEEDLYVPFYGGRQFGIRDPDGLSLVFWQPDWLVSSEKAAPQPPSGRLSG